MTESQSVISLDQKTGTEYIFAGDGEGQYLECVDEFIHIYTYVKFVYFKYNLFYINYTSIKHLRKFAEYS